jgi:nitric oxide reductase NorD protein
VNPLSQPASAMNSAAALIEMLSPQLTRFMAFHGGDEGRAQAELAKHWLHLLHEEDPPSAFAVAERLSHFLDRMSADALGRWILAGWRCHATDLSKQRAWFRLDDPQSIAALHGEAGAQPLQEALPSLDLLINGLLETTRPAPHSDSASPLLVQARQQTELNAPRLRPVLTPTHLLVPNDYTVLDGAGDRSRLYRAAVAHAVAHLHYSMPARAVRTLKPMGIAVVSAIEDARVEHLLLRDFPGVRGWFVGSLAAPPDPGDLSFAALLSRLDRVLIDATSIDDNYWVNKARRLFDETMALAGLEDYDAFRAMASILANDLGQMRVRFNPQQYVVPAPYRDDNSYLWDYGEPKTPPDDNVELLTKGARAPIDLTPRQNESTEQTAGAAEMELGRFSYPEWDRRIERLRPDWCTVIEKLSAWQGISAVQNSPGRSERLSPIALPHAMRFSRTRRLRRQWEGDDIDLNAAIDVMVQRRSQLQPEPRLFLRAGREQVLSSILVLLDLSESTNDRVSSGAMSLLDIEKQAALWLAESVLQGADRLAVHGFSSNTRDEVYYYRLLDFGSALTSASHGMISAVQARYSTRMGAALRHATMLLQQEPHSQRAILLVTDGAPSDIDVHEPHYLTEDARAAVIEARNAGVQTHCIAVDAGDDSYVQRIFGWRNFTMVQDAYSLPVQLQRACLRLMTQ